MLTDSNLNFDKENKVAIFLHIAQPNMTPTDGCIALRFDDLCWILEQELRAIYVSN